jgi:hypothetical protein
MLNNLGIHVLRIAIFNYDTGSGKEMEAPENVLFVELIAVLWIG